MTEIHPSAVVDPKARLAPGVRVGPFCHVGPDVELGEGCELHAHVTMLGPTRAGRNNIFFPQCVIGAAPQDLKYRGGPTAIEIGNDNIIREQVTIHRGTEVDRQSGGVTRIGDKNLLMVGVHVAHDVAIGNHVILANQVQIAGHVCIEDCVNVGGAAAMHHFVTIGRNAFIGGMTRVTHDAPPYMKVVGYDAEVRGLNAEGLRRWKFSEDSILRLRNAFRMLYTRKTARSPGRMAEALREIQANGLIHDPCVLHLVSFLERKLSIGIYGRTRERFRKDTDADRAAFYAAQPSEGD